VGAGKTALADALRAARSGLRANDFGPSPLPTYIGRVEGLESLALPPELARWDCRNNRLAWLGLQADGFIDAVADARQRYGASRVALLLGTSTSAIGETEAAYTQADAEGRFQPGQRRPQVHTPHSLGLFVQAALGLEGPCETISTACSSSAKAFASAERLIRLGLADAAVVGGVDTLCGSVLYGSTRWSWCRPSPANLSMPRATASAWARLQASRWWNVRRPPRPTACTCWATARQAMRTTCRRHTRRAWAPSARSTTRWPARA